MGYYIHGFKLSIYYLKKIADMGAAIEDDYYYKLMCEVCDFGGDTDTNCAIVGAMVGPLIGYKNFNNQYFNRFIRFIPEERSQFNSAFMYIYVNCLEEKFLKNQKETINEEQNKNEPNIEKEAKINEGEIKNPEDPNKKEELAEKENKNDMNNKIDKIIDNGINSINEIINKENFDLNIKKKEDENTDNNKIFKYTAFHLIMKFLNKKITIKK